MTLLSLQYASAFCFLVPLGTKYVSQHYTLTHSACTFTSVSETKFHANIKQRWGSVLVKALRY
jgi:hypothetical protein